MAKKIKIKTHSGAKKRFNITKNGKITITEKNGKVPTELRIPLTPSAAKRSPTSCGISLALPVSIPPIILRSVP